MTLPAGTTVVGSQPSVSLTLAVDAATAAALDAQAALGALSLRLAAGAVADASGNGNLALGAPGLPVSVLGTSVVINGRIDADEWAGAQVLNDQGDSGWTSANEIDRLLVKWDAEYLYVAIDGQVSGNSWLLYLDVDPGSANGHSQTHSQPSAKPVGMSMKWCWYVVSTETPISRNHASSKMRAKPRTLRA